MFQDKNHEEIKKQSTYHGFKTALAVFINYTNHISNIINNNHRPIKYNFYRKSALRYFVIVIAYETKIRQTTQNTVLPHWRNYSYYV